VIILIWVDDLITFTDSCKESSQFEKELQNRFDIKIIGEPLLLLGMTVLRNILNGMITLSQSHYIEKILMRFGLHDANPVLTPLNSNIKLDDEKQQDEAQSDGRGSGPYTMAIGSLLYIGMGTWPDISFAVQTLAQYTHDLKPIHWSAVKHIFRCLKGTQSHALIYQ
jgi:hypothetical protein